MIPNFFLGGSMEAATPEQWLPPCAQTVIAVAENAANADVLAWSDWLRRDPGIVWFVFTYHEDYSLDRVLAALRHGIDPQPFLARLLKAEQPGFADWSTPGAGKAYKQSQFLGGIAEYLAQKVRLDPLLASCLGQMTLLGPLVQSQHQGTRNSKDPSVVTRQLIRRATCPMWLRELLLALDLPEQEGQENKDWSRWALVLQCALSMSSRSTSQQSLGKLAAKRLGLSWDQEVEVAAQLSQHLSVPPAPLSADSANLLIRSLRLHHDQPARTLSFTVRQLEDEVEDLRCRLAKTKQLDLQLLQEQKLTAVAELAAGAGHEINNPLAVISGQAQYLLKNEEDLNRAKALERIISQTGRIHVLLRDLMLFARPPEPHYKSILVHKLLKSSAKGVTELALTRGIKVDLAGLSPKLTVSCDHQLLETAVRCLLQNSIEAAPAGGWVRLTAHAQRGRLTIQVEDNGPGVPFSVQENVFDPFFSGRSAGRGVGLGLSKVWRIAQLHGGDVRLETHAGQPTRFTLEIPLKPARRPANKSIRLKRSA